MITRLKPILALMLLAYLLPILALAAPDEASGIVTNVVDGDTFDIRIEKTDPRIIYEIERVRLADVDSPEMSTPEGPPAKVYTTETLLGKKVWLDIDDRSKDGRDMYERILAVVYLEDLNGTINTTHPFNRLLVDAGFAVVKDFTNNEFDPAAWWENETSNYMFEAATVKGVGYKNVEKLILTPSAPTSTSSGKFVGSLESDKYHYPSCRWAKKILPQNQIWFASSEEARAAGYVPCGVCKPP
ncbi:MAG: thermonuclease family protein [Methanothrix sp.]|nr:thermonuclease family protein [Methanothrix sp.]